MMNISLILLSSAQAYISGCNPSFC